MKKLLKLTIAELKTAIRQGACERISVLTNLLSLLLAEPSE